MTLTIGIVANQTGPHRWEYMVTSDDQLVTGVVHSFHELETIVHRIHKQHHIVKINVTCYTN